MTGIERDLAQSIDETLHRAAHLNEVRVAWVRALNLSIVTALGTVIMSPTTLRLSAAWTACAWLIIVLKRLGHYRRVAIWATTILDGAMVASFTLVSEPGQPLLLASTALVCTLFAISGAIRIERWWVWVTTALAIANVAFASHTNGLTIAEGTVLCLLTGVSGLLGSWLGRISRHALESEVHRVVAGKFLPARVLDAGYRNSLSSLTEARAVDATVLISDIRSFTTYAETLPPAEVLEFLNHVQGTFAAIVQAHGGMIDKFMGDGMLAVFGAPEPLDDHASRAIGAARSIAAAASAMPIRVGVGVHSGRVVTGVLGNGARLELTVIGDTVNIAARLEALTKEKEVTVLISDAVVDRASNSVNPLVRLGPARLRGRSREVVIYTLAA